MISISKSNFCLLLVTLGYALDADFIMSTLPQINGTIVLQTGGGVESNTITSLTSLETLVSGLRAGAETVSGQEGSNIVTSDEQSSSSADAGAVTLDTSDLKVLAASSTMAGLETNLETEETVIAADVSTEESTQTTTPSSTDQPPVTTTDQPPSTTEEPSSTTSQQPSSTTQEPSSTTQGPSSTTQDSDTSTITNQAISTIQGTTAEEGSLVTAQVGDTIIVVPIPTSAVNAIEPITFVDTAVTPPLTFAILPVTPVRIVPVTDVSSTTILATAVPVITDSGSGTAGSTLSASSTTERPKGNVTRTVTPALFTGGASLEGVGYAKGSFMALLGFLIGAIAAL